MSCIRFSFVHFGRRRCARAKRATVLRGTSRHCAIAAALWTAHAVPAAADPWTMPAGQGRTIITGIYSKASETFDDSGHAVRASRYDQQEIYFQTEYGLTDDLTLLATPSLRRVASGDGRDSMGIGYTELGARYRLYHRDGFILSGQASVFIPGIKRRDPVAQIGSKDVQTDLRGQMGYGFSIGTMPAFASADGGYRFRSDGRPNEIHTDLVLGIRPARRLMMIANIFGTWSDGATQAVPAYRYTTTYAGVTYDLTRRLTLQFGGLATLNGRNALRERGLYTGLWIKF